MKTPDSPLRDKILATAEQLIYEHGIQAMGMDLLVRTSGVARKSIYRYFTTKDDIAAAALSARDERWMNWFRHAVDQANGPRARLLGMFDVLTGWFASEGFRGCAFINTAGEIGDPQSPVREISKQHKLNLLAYTHGLCEQLGCAQPAVLAKQLLILMDGAITLARVMGDLDAARNAQPIAQLLLAEAGPPPVE